MSALMLLNVLLILAGPFAVVLPMAAVAQRAGQPARSWRMPRLSVPVPRLAVSW